MKMIKSLLDFFKNPVYKIDKDLSLKYKFIILGQLLAIALFISLGIAMLIGVLEEVTELDFGEHALDELFSEYSPEFIFLIVVIIAPILEELIFRGPLYLFRRSAYFGLIFYLFSLAFGFYHITNFEVTTTILYLSPLLVSPQLIIGLLLGYIRVRLGLGWSILLHACYNFVLIGPIIVVQALDIPLQ